VLVLYHQLFRGQIMDAAQKLLKTSAILLAIALLMAAPGWAQTPTLVAPSSVVIGNTTVSDPVSVTSSDGTTVITYTISAPDYSVDGSGSRTGWLSAPSGTGFTTPTASLIFRIPTTAGVNSGASAKITLTPTAPASAVGGPVTITVTFSPGGGGGNTTLTANPASPISLSAAANSLASTNVTITTSSVSLITISATSSVSGAVSNWLNSSSITGSTTINSGNGTTLTINANSAGLTAGTVYQGTITLTPSGGSPLVIVVNFTVGTSVGNGTWTATPGSVPFSYTTNSQSFPTQPISIATTGSSTTYQVNTTTDNGGSWLLAYLPSVANSDAYSLSAIPVATQFGLKIGTQANNLTAGTYTGRATISDPAGVAQLFVNVTLTVNGGASTTFTVTPNPISFNTAVNGAQQSQTVNVFSGSGGNLSVSASLPAGLTYQLPSNTSIAAGGSLAFTVFANPSGLAASTYTGTLSVFVGSQSAVVSVQMVVGGGGTGTTAVAPVTLTFAYQLGTDPVNFIARQKLAITGPAGAWSSSIATANGSGWLILVPSSGSALPDPADSNQAPIVSIDATGLTAGSYAGTIVVNTLGGAQSISVSLVVGTSAILLPTPGSLVFAAKTGQPKPTGQLVFFSGSDTTLNPLAITAASNNSWITVTNDDRSVSVQVDQTGLTTGVYSGSVNVTQAGAANSPDLIPVVLVVNGGGGGGGTPPANSNVTVSPTSLTFSAGSGSNPATQTLGVTSASGSAGISFTTQVTVGSSWLSISANTSSTPSTLTVTVNSSALVSGSYSGNILISPTGGNPVNIPVSLTIMATPGVSATPATLTFNFIAGAPTPAAQQLSVSGSGSSFSATASSNGNWLAVSPATGTGPATLNVSVDPSSLGANTYTGTVTVAGTGGATGSTTVTVTLNVTAPLPTVSRVTNAASYATGSISPGEIITLFSSDSSIGPATAAGLALDSTGKVSTTIGGVQVTVNGFFCPMVFASASQVSAVVPYEIKGFASATVLVKFRGVSSNGVLVNVATTVPGVFTANASGTGPGAIANSNGSTNAPSNPAARGDTVVVYLTGEGETSPFGVTGKVTTVAAPPQPLTPAPLLPVSVTVGGQPANWSFAGEAPSFVSGVMQLNVVLPTNIAAGEQAIVVSLGGNPSQQGVTVSVK
jgi:uncharacterized protein (TIGR03437 family)